VREMLELMGYEVEVAKDGAEALQRYMASKRGGNPFSAVIMDLTVPEGMGGKEAIRRLREMDPNVKAIVSSGYSYDPVMASFREFGFSGVIPKPYVMEDLGRVLDEVIARRGLPQAIRCDNGPELTSRHFLAWGLEWKIELRHIQPGRPMQNGHVESFHGRLREECLRASWFSNLFDARSKITDWRKEYNEVRPHSSLDYRTPREFAETLKKASYGKDADFVCLENAAGVSHFATAPTTR